MLWWNEDCEPGQCDKDGAGDVRLHEMERHLPPQDDSHDDARIRQLIVVGGVIVSNLNLQIKLGKADVAIDIVA